MKVGRAAPHGAVVRALGCALVLLYGCALPENTALRDWAWTASVVADRPAMVIGVPGATADPPARHAAAGQDLTQQDGLRAMQQALAIYLYALGVIAEDRQLVFRSAEYDGLAPRATATDAGAARAIAELGQLLHRAGVEDAGARAPQRDRPGLRTFLRTGDAPLQALVAGLVEGAQGAHEATPPPDTYAAARTGYIALLHEIATVHAMLRERARHITQEALARDVRIAEDALRRGAARLPPDGLQAATLAPGDAVARTVQP